jgi:predicted RNase H-like HicB family nuclease
MYYINNKLLYIFQKYINWREVTFMLTEYIQEALKRAQYQIIQDDEPYYAEIPELKGVWATGKNLEECRKNLIEVIEGWLILSIKKNLPIPKLGEISIDEVKMVKM